MPNPLYTHGLIGKCLVHSQSPRLFATKFAQCPEKSYAYGLFELDKIADLAALWEIHPTLRALNVTFPYKMSVCDYVDVLDPIAARIGAVNVLKKLPNGRVFGYNTDYIGFSDTLHLLPGSLWKEQKALICGQGGAGRAVKLALEAMGIQVCSISRTEGRGDLTYATLASNPSQLHRFGLLVQATPLGTYPNTESPPLPYDALNSSHLLYDLAYNPPKTPFLQEGEKKHCYTKNGNEMLAIQAEAAWQIWEKE